MDDVNERISSWFEPPSLLTEIPFDHTSLSPKRFWTWSRDKEGNRVLHPLNYFHDESANARLLEAMPFPSLNHYSGTTDSDKPAFWECEGESDGKQFSGAHDDRKTAVVLAFCKWANIPTEER